MQQEPLFHAEHLPARLVYQKLFTYLPAMPSPLRADPAKGGRPGVDRNILLRAFIYRALRRLTSLSDLVQELHDNTAVAEAIGLNPVRTVPSIERFSDWLHSADNTSLQQVRVQLLQTLFTEHAFTGRILALDSCPILSPVRENNLKTAVRDRFDKLRFPKGDPTARLGILTHFVQGDSRKVVYFWGYRNHVVVDTETELPLWEQTEPADRHDGTLAIPLVRALMACLPLPVAAVCADSAYDAEAFLRFIASELQAKPIVARNPRRQAMPGFQLKGSGVICPANLEMVRHGKNTVKRTGITYLQFSCPIHNRRSMARRYLVCPASHPKFFEQKGCNYLIRLTPTIRSEIPYGSESFQQIYRERTSVERVFARLLAVAMQDLPTRGLIPARNLCTIAHITVLLVALAALRTGHPDQLAFVRSFLPHLERTLFDTGVL